MEARPDAQIEDFLDRVFARLVAILPYEERLARREAMRAQIEQSITAHIELGSTPQEALALTLAQTRREQAVASQAVQRSSKLEIRAQPSARPATIAALSFFGLFYLLDQTQIAGHLWNLRFHDMFIDGGGVNQKSAAVAGFYRFELLVLPVLCGLAVGLLSKHRPVRGVLNALALLSIPAIAWGGVAYGLYFAGLISLPQWMKFVFPILFQPCAASAPGPCSARYPPAREAGFVAACRVCETQRDRLPCAQAALCAAHAGRPGAISPSPRRTPGHWAREVFPEFDRNERPHIMFGDIKSKRLILIKGFLFLGLGIFALAILALDTQAVRPVALALIAIWAFCRFYYFMFYCIEKYVDPSYKFTGITSFVLYLLNQTRKTQ